MVNSKHTPIQVLGDELCKTYTCKIVIIIIIIYSYNDFAQKQLFFDNM